MQTIPAERDPDSTTFSFWVPIQKSHAATRRDAPPPRILQGLTSRGDKDQIGEWMDQDTIVFEPLIRSGIINWNHQPGPQNIIGEPLEAELRETKAGYGLWMRGQLWDAGKHAGADAAWQLVEAMESSRARKLGWSVEGGILRRDPGEHAHITKSFVRHMALTHEPIHAATYAEIAKSFGQAWVGGEVAFHPERNEHLAFESFESFAKAMGSGPGVTVAGVATGDFSPLRGNAFADVQRFLGKGCRGKCRLESRGRNTAFTHIHECLGHDEDAAFDFVKSMIDALD